MFKADETAKDLFRRLFLPVIFVTKVERIDKLEFGESLEIQADSKDIAETVLSLTFQFLNQCNVGTVLHVSTGNNLHFSLLQSKIKIEDTVLALANNEGRLLSCTISSAFELYSAFQTIENTYADRSLFLVLEALSPTLIAEKALDGSLPSTSMTRKVLVQAQRLCNSMNIIIVWVTALCNRKEGSLRNGSSPDALSLLWRQHYPRHSVWRQHPQQVPEQS